MDNPLENVSCNIVSDDSELLILVDPDDKVVGHLDKSACHDGEGLLHRAFSLFVFNPQGKLLIQRRAPSKRLWPSYWSNSCCSHPRQNENMDTAAQRRCEEELGFRTPLKFLYKFQYSAPFGALGSENELCSVYVGRFDGSPKVNSNEICEWQWLAPDELDKQLEQTPEQFTPWFKMEWRRLQQDFATQIAHASVLENEPGQL